MGASESRDQSSNGTDDSRRRSDENSSQISTTSIAVAGAVGAAVGAGLLAWNRSRAASTEPEDSPQNKSYLIWGSNSMIPNPRTSLHYVDDHDDDDGADLGDEDRYHLEAAQIHKWVAPPIGAWMVNTDGSHIQGSRGGAGGIIRNYKGQPIAAFACAFEEEDVLVHELQAILHGINLALEIGDQNQIIVATDCKSAYDDINMPDQIVNQKIKNPLVRELVKLVKVAMRGFERCTLTHVHRNSNKVADYFSRLCSEIGEQRTLYPGEFTGPAWKLIKEDVNGLIN
ncbi:uncharacterized protein LOC131167721 isoform X2 [Malania oleifera]|nr:uncharacterized protein LOC131167721 isoform X2 [Malania oleifera]